MTNREFLEAVKANSITPEVVAYAIAAIEKLDAKNLKRASTPSKTAIANEPLKAQVLDFLGGRTSALASEIGEALGLTTAKASSLCTSLVKAGKVTVAEVKVPKVGKRNAYFLVVGDDDATDNDEE